MNIFLVILIVHTFFDSWLLETVIFNLGPLNIYAIDLMHLLLMYAMACVVFSAYCINAMKEEPLYIIFLLWLFIEILIGFTRYGYRALGETRSISHFLVFFVPYYLLNKKQQTNTDYIIKIIRKTIYCLAVASLVVYVIKSSLDYQTITDFRGVRYVGSTQTFNIALLICFYAFKYIISNQISLKELILLIISIVIALLTKNRAGLISPIILAFLVYARYIKAKKLAYLSIIVVLTVIAFKSITPDTVVTEVDDAFSGAINPTTDLTGKWRMAIQLVALKQSFETFWFGQGYGSYFQFVVAEKYRNITYEVSPHNQFLVIILKAGVVGVVLLLSLLISYIYKSYKLLDKISDRQNEKIYVLLLMTIITSQIIYGMAYEFIPFFGLFYGFGALLMRSVKRDNLITAESAKSQINIVRGKKRNLVVQGT